MIQLSFDFQHKYSDDSLPQPFPPSRSFDKWDADHVRMPCSEHNEYPVDNGVSVSMYSMVLTDVLILHKKAFL
jgi:hypothetical protein